MFRTINQKFYSIAGVLVFLFCFGYAQVAYFINQQTSSAAQVEEIIGIERGTRNLLSLFFRLQYWERAVFTQDFPDAEQNFGQVMAQMKSQLLSLSTRSPSTLVPNEFDRVVSLLATYEQDFNRLNQLNTDQRLQLTRLNSSYQSLVSAILGSGKLNLLKSLLNVTHFQMSYVNNHRQTEYQALQVVLDSLKKKFAQEALLDDRLDSYLNS